MSVIIDFLKENYTWIFSGIGVFIISLFFMSKGSKRTKNSVKNGNGNIQAGGNIITNKSDKGKYEQSVK